MKKLTCFIGSLLLISGSTLAATTATDCVKTDKATIEDLFDRWNASLKTGDAKKVTDTYSDGCSLITDCL